MTKISPSLLRLAEPVLGKPVRIIVWKNGEFQAPGQEISISPKALRSWNSILVYLTKVLEFPGAVRKLYHLPTKKTVWCFDDLTKSGHYVAAGFEKLKLENDAYKKVSDRRYSILQAVKFTCKTDCLKAMLDTITYTQIKRRTIIYIMVNGKSCLHPCKIVFIEEDLNDWESVLQYVGHRLNVPEGIQYLCTVKGEIVFESHQLHHADLYIGVPFGQKFKKIDYVKLFHELMKRQKERLPYYPRKKSKSKKNLTTTYAPWSIKNKKGPRISATILTPRTINTGIPDSGKRPSVSSPCPSHSADKSSKRSSDSKKASTNVAVYSVQACKMERCLNKNCVSSCKKTESGTNVASSTSQTTGEQETPFMKHKLENVCLGAVKNSGFIESQKTDPFQKARELNEDQIKQISAKQTENDFDSGNEYGTNLTTFAKLAQRNNSSEQDTQNSKSRSENLKNNSKVNNNKHFFKESSKLLRSSIREPVTGRTSKGSIQFKDAMELDESSDSEIAITRTFSKKTLSPKEILDLKKSQETKTSNVPRQDSIDLYKDKIWHDSPSRTGLEKVPPHESNFNFVQGSNFSVLSNNSLANKKSSECETLLDTSDADVNELWKKPSAPSTEKSIDERSSSSENGSSRTIDRFAEIELDQGQTSKIRGRSAPTLNCCTSSKLVSVINRIKQRHPLEYVSSDDDPFAASERRARAKNVFINKDNTIFGQLGTVVVRNGQSFMKEHVETPPTEGAPSKSSKKSSSKEDTIIERLVKITSETLHPLLGNSVDQHTSTQKASLQKVSSLNDASNQKGSSFNGTLENSVSDASRSQSVQAARDVSQSSSRVKIVLVEVLNGKIQKLDPITSCSEQSNMSKQEKIAEIVRTSYSDVSGTPSATESVKTATKCFSFACSDICLKKTTDCKRSQNNNQPPDKL